MRKLSTDLIKSGSFTGSFSGSVIGTITSASFASTASYLLNSFSLTTGSSYPITSSWSNNSISSSFSNTSISSSYSLTSSNLSPVAQNLIPFTSSTYSLGSPTNKWKDLYVSTGSIYIGNVVLSTSGSTLYADVQPIVTLNTASGQIEISGMSASLSASYSNTSSIALNAISSSYSLSGSYVKNADISQTSTSSSYSNTSSIALNAISSSYGLTSSYSLFANNSNNSSTSTSASYSSTASVALNALTSSYINVATNAVSSSYASTASISVSSSFATTSSYNLNSISSSYSLTASFAANAGSSLSTGSTYPITASWSNNSISSSYSTFAVSSTSATSANTATSASYATVASSSTSATTANSATSASYSLSSSYSVNSTTAISSSFASTASYVANSVSSSYALTASYALNAGGGGTTLTTGSTYPITSSWANNATTASYALNSSGGSTPVVSVASLNNQTILYNFSSSQEVTITGLTLTNNNWGINVVEEWNSGSGDIYYPSCSILLHFSGSNNSTTFLDNGPNNFTISANGDAKITSSISKFGSGSGFFDGTGDYLSVTNNTVFAFGTGNFTVEAWIYRTGGSGNQPICQSDAIGGSTNDKWWFAVTSTGLFFGTHDAGGFSVTTTTTFNTNTWYHVAVTRNSGTMYLFINGVSTAFTTSGTPSGYSLSQNGLSIGGMSTPSYWTGYIDELRITKGIARYTGSFTTQSVEFPNQLPQYETKYIGLIGGLNDTGSDYGVQKLDDTSLKIRKMSVSGTPVSGSPILSSSVDRVYVNVLNYTNVSVGSPLLGQTFTAVGSTSSYALSRSVVNPYEIVVAVDGAVQSFNNAYSVTSSTINFTENIPSGSLVDIRFLTTPNVNSASFATTSSYSLSGGTTSGKSIALSFILG